MKKSLYSLLIAAVVSIGATFAQAAEVTTEAVVLKLKGTAQAVFPGKIDAVAIKEGDKLPEGTVITTGEASEAELQIQAGTVATVKASTTISLEKLSVTSSGGAISKQTALINLKSGSVLSNLDPAKKSVNDYGIRTPKGVAAARGTVYTVNVSATGAVQVFVTNSTVVFISPTGESVTVEAGFVVTVDENGVVGVPTAAPQSLIDAAAGAQGVFEIDPAIVSGSR
jgi:hypothetical protein